MYELVYCRCNLAYGERPEVYSASNPHPKNFCPQCSRGISLSDCRVERVPENQWIHTPKHHFQHNYVDY